MKPKATRLPDGSVPDPPSRHKGSARHTHCGCPDLVSQTRTISSLSRALPASPVLAGAGCTRSVASDRYRFQCALFASVSWSARRSGFWQPHPNCAGVPMRGRRASRAHRQGRAERVGPFLQGALFGLQPQRRHHDEPQEGGRREHQKHAAQAELGVQQGPHEERADHAGETNEAVADRGRPGPHARGVQLGRVSPGSAPLETCRGSERRSLHRMIRWPASRRGGPGPSREGVRHRQRTGQGRRR